MSITKKATLYDTATQAKLACFEHEEKVRSVALSADGSKATLKQPPKMTRTGSTPVLAEDPPHKELSARQLKAKERSRARKDAFHQSVRVNVRTLFLRSVLTPSQNTVRTC